MPKHEDSAGQDPQIGSISALGILAVSLALRLTPDELEWLSRELKERAEDERRKAGGEVAVLAGYRDAWDPVSESVA
jgi:hypothetical protein